MAGIDGVRRIPADVLRRLHDVALEWASYNGCPQLRSMRAVSTTRDAATKVLHGPDVTSRPDDDIYLVVVEGEITL